MTDERRKRYAAALYKIANPHFRWVDLHEGMPDHDHWLDEADAAITVADEELRVLEGDCIRLSEELDDAREANVELSRYARDAAHWEAVADRMRGEIARLRAEHDRERVSLCADRNRAEATIERVRAVVDAADLSERETGFFMNLCDALDGTA
ncbi:hypothetical protein HEK616_40730 [Streptomyces nigrescens]|uniref:Uncharacterized protein n=1 Tax=Streptomyces nigrescens TaxID=1920 RepID=A0ABN6R100_STRNI|nr:hypothetical protein [Streptomyces nigrescens]BDM70586.1 hypothetical protein HEK616_40730 [Streptomyces nigrescens]